MNVPEHPKIYHIVHANRLPSIINDKCLWCDAGIIQRRPPGTAIGMNSIKQRRLNNTLNSYPNLRVGDCVPFYFCPRSIMLYLIYQANHPELHYRGGQDPIIHLQADLHTVVAWAKKNSRRWVFTLSNAGANYFEDRKDLAKLQEIDWAAVQATDWQSCKEGKQAEFLLEHSFPLELVDKIGVKSEAGYYRVANALTANGRRPQIELRQDWYY